ncbi:hypothetical protein FGO68_gene11732 [Halteria grandinella]|uniref:Uncharacterized protein n=1 Tax=Halteria grandinella TaxID=5974 RepID=A0A8J8SVB9_HALGN|nr:hypothetical protein FGO68_gene11732 [Halteria grandinella]
MYALVSSLNGTCKSQKFYRSPHHLEQDASCVGVVTYLDRYRARLYFDLGLRKKAKHLGIIADGDDPGRRLCKGFLQSKSVLFQERVAEQALHHSSATDAPVLQEKDLKHAKVNEFW